MRRNSLGPCRTNLKTDVLCFRIPNLGLNYLHVCWAGCETKLFLLFLCLLLSMGWGASTHTIILYTVPPQFCESWFQTSDRKQHVIGRNARSQNLQENNGDHVGFKNPDFGNSWFDHQWSKKSWKLCFPWSCFRDSWCQKPWMHNSRSQTEMPQTHYFKDPETHPPQLTPQIQINHVSTLKSKATITQVKPSWLLCSRQFYNLWTRADSEPTQNPPQIAQLVSGTRPVMENTSGKRTSHIFCFPNTHVNMRFQ